jgi:NADH-quinone oxidoreductase subunit H
VYIDSSFIGQVFTYADSLLKPLAGAFYAEALSLLAAFIVFAIILAILIVGFVYLFGWGERKMMARVHSRHGPTYLGKFGILQNMADVLKLLSKENIVPDSADKPLYGLVLPLFYAMMVMVLAFIPITGTFVGINATLGLLVVFLLLSFSPMILFLAGWTSGNKFASISAQRSVIIMVSYELPMLFVVVAVAMLAHSYNLISIVNAQNGLWFGLMTPIGLFVFFVVMLAELERPPFDLREADNELIAGWLTDVSAPYYGLALFLDYTRMFVGSLLISLLFLGGWLGPLLPAAFWMIFKVVLVTVFIIILRTSMIRMRLDRLIHTGWMYMLPLSLLNILITFIVFVR